MRKFDVSKPRWRYWISRARKEMKCPRCSTVLEKEQHPYVVLIKQFDETETFICGNDAGYFCSNCPTVVLDRERFERTIKFSVEVGMVGDGVGPR
jgi:hypothetical protein